MSKPTTLAPASMIAVNTRPISGVQVTLGLPSNGGVLKVSSSSATTAAGEDAGGCRLVQKEHSSVADRLFLKPRHHPTSGAAAARSPMSADSTAAIPAA